MISILSNFRPHRWRILRNYGKQWQTGARRDENTDYITSLIETHHAQNPQPHPNDWNNLKDEIFKFSRRYTNSNIDAIIVGICMGLKKNDLVFNYIDYLKQFGALSLAVIGKLFRLHYNVCISEGVTVERESQIIALYENVRQTYPLLDSLTNENIIMAMSLTSKWKVCLETLEEIKISCEPTHAAYSCIVIAAFKNNEDELAWSLLEEMPAKNRTPPEICFLEYMKTLESLDKEVALAKIEKLLHFLGYNDFACTENMAINLKELFDKYHIETAITQVTSMGVCFKCKTRLPRFTLTDAEFNEVKRSFMESAIVGKDVFRKSTPNELENFQNFVAKQAKYDVIIDGLNVAYMGGSKRSVHDSANMVVAVVKHFLEKRKSVLVMGRNHMKRWPAKYLSFINKNAHMFLTQDLSQDDPYLLYCALNSGVQTSVVTRDLMRNHLYLLKDAEHKKLFRRWLSQSLLPLQYVSGDGKVVLKPPLPFLKIAQKYRNTWHIPYVKNDNINREEWLCVKL